MAGGVLAGVITYTTPESKNEWTDELDLAVSEMRAKAGSERIHLIGEYAMNSMDYKPKFPHFYLNEIAAPPSMQGRGIGAAMIKDVELECVAHPEAIGTGLDTSSADNVRLYKRLG